MKKIGGVYIDEDSFAEMLKNFDTSKPKNKRNENLDLNSKTELVYQTKGQNRKEGMKLKETINRTEIANQKEDKKNRRSSKIQDSYLNQVEAISKTNLDGVKSKQPKK